MHNLTHTRVENVKIIQFQGTAGRDGLDGRDGIDGVPGEPGKAIFLIDFFLAKNEKNSGPRSL